MAVPSWWLVILIVVFAVRLLSDICCLSLCSCAGQGWEQLLDLGSKWFWGSLGDGQGGPLAAASPRLLFESRGFSAFPGVTPSLSCQEMADKGRVHCSWPCAVCAAWRGRTGSRRWLCQICFLWILLSFAREGRSFWKWPSRFGIWTLSLLVTGSQGCHWSL